MNCPLCLDTVLDVTYHAGIELDICPKCRGVWLDRGELNRIVDEMSDRPTGAAPASAGRFDTRPPGRPDQRPDHRPDHRADDQYGDRRRKKKSFASRLGEVFEDIVDL